MLLLHTVSVLEGLEPGANVIVERSPVDYIAYAAASRSAWSAPVVAEFLDKHVPTARAVARNLDLIALVPLSSAIAARPGEDERFRRRVDDRLRRALIDDEHDMFGNGSPAIVELGTDPTRQLAELLRLTNGGSR
jgi:hypothetical protein